MYFESAIQLNLLNYYKAAFLGRTFAFAMLCRCVAENF